MKFIKIFSIFLVVLIILISISLVVAIRTLDINQFKTYIAQKISETLKREVKIDKVALDFAAGHGMILNVKGLSIADDPKFSVDDFFTVKSAHLGIDALKLISKKQVVISKVEFHEPYIHLIIATDGKSNLESFMAPFNESSESEEQGLDQSLQKSAEGAPKKEKSEISPELLIKSIRITNGRFDVINKTKENPVIIGLERFNFHTTNLSFNNPFQFQADASFLSQQSNIMLKGQALINEKNQQIRLDDVNLRTKMSDLSLEMLMQLFPGIKENPIDEQLRGDILIVVNQLVVGKKGLLVLSLNGQLIDGRVKLRSYEYPIDNIDMRFEVTESDININELFAYLASGKIDFRGRVNEYLQTRDFRFNVNLQDINVKELLSVGSLPVEMEGVLFGKFEGKGNNFTREAIEESLTAEGSIFIQDGRLLDINVLKIILTKISKIPNFSGENLADKLEANLPEKYKKKLAQKDTDITRFVFDVKVGGGTLMLSKGELEAEEFLMTALGSLNLAQNLTLDTKLYLPKDLSDGIITSVPELQTLVRENNQIEIPFKPYKGLLHQIYIVPDFGSLAQNIILEKGRQELKKVLNKALDIEDTPEPEDSGTMLNEDVESQEQNGNTPRPEDLIIDDVLDLLFK